MPNLETIRTSIAKLPQERPLVIALVGATTGIGSYVARVWATTFAEHGSELRVYIVGRNAARADTLLQFGRKTSPGSDWRFVQVKDLSLIREVDEASRSIAEQEKASPFAEGPPRLDVLYLNQAQSPVVKSNGRQYKQLAIRECADMFLAATSEGLDTQMSLLYYSRIRFIQNLTPLMLASQDNAHVISIFAGNMEDGVKPGELPIGVPPPASYGITSVRRNTAFMKTFILEELAKKHASKISFVHIYPGLVDGPGFYSEANPWWFRTIWPVMKLVLSWYMTSPEVCGQVVVSLATKRYPAKSTVVEGVQVTNGSQHEQGGGAYAVGQRGDESKGVSWAKQRRENTTKEVWRQTTEVLERIGNSNVAL